MQKFFVGAIIFLGAILQTSFLSNFFPIGLVPDVVLILVIIWTAKADFNTVWARAVFAGLVLDLFSFWPIGVNIFSFAAVSFATNSLCKRFLIPQSFRKFLVFSIAIVMGTIINHVIMNIFFGLKSSSWSGLATMFDATFFLKPVLNLIAFPVLYWLLEKIEKISMPQNKMIIRR